MDTSMHLHTPAMRSTTTHAHLSFFFSFFLTKGAILFCLLVGCVCVCAEERAEVHYCCRTTTPLYLRV